MSNHDKSDSSRAEVGTTAYDPDRYYDYGDWVEFKLNTNVFGIVVGSDVMGLQYHVQLAGSGAIMPFFGATLAPIDPSELEPFDGESAAGDNGAAANDNAKKTGGELIDFTKARDLRVAKTRGAA
jgi:hypothetical protein